MNFIADDLNDSLDDLIGARSDVARAPAPSRPAPADFVPDRTFVEGCPKCRGSGQTPWGVCFKCKGAGKKVFKTSASQRAANRQGSHERKQRSVAQETADNFQTFKASNAELCAWLEAKSLTFDFAAKMVAAIGRWGSLTDGQRAAVERCIEKDTSREIQRAERIQSAPQVDTAGIDRLKAAFDKARAYSAAKAKGVTLRNPKITIGGLTISPAKATSANPGALYVKAGQDYLGKIVDGKLMAVSACSPAQREQILKFVADPADAAKVYGQETGVCCVCNATLKSEWRLRGIGPVCAEKMGW